MTQAVEGDRGTARTPVPLVVRTDAQLAEAVEYLQQWPVITLDVETDSLYTTTNEVTWIGFAVPDRVFLVPMGHARGRVLTPASMEKRLPPLEERKLLRSGNPSNAKKAYRVPATYGDPGTQLRQDKVFSALRPLLFSKVTKNGHNLKFDLESIAKYYGGEIPPGPYCDTMILTHILDENLTAYGLKSLVMSWLNVPKEERKEFYPNLGRSGIEAEPIDAVARYLAKDVWYTHLYRLSHIDKIRSNPCFNYTFWVEMQVYPVLMRTELNGIRINVDLLQERGSDLADQRQRIAERIWDICGEQYAISNVEKKRIFLFGPKRSGGQDLKPLSFTPKAHKPQLNTEVLEHYAPTNELARLFLDWADKEKLISTFITGLEKRLVDNRLHTSFNQHRTVTGRLSSNDPNLQQIPRGPLIRETFISDPGHSLIVADYDQVELRCSAALSGDKEMIRVFQNGEDIHTQAAAAMYQLAPEDVQPVQRQVGKTMNFGTLFGAGPEKIAYTAGVNIDTARAFIRRYYLQFHGVSQWKDTMIDIARRTGHPKGPTPYAEIPPWGRKRRLPALYSPDVKERAKAERQVVNAIVQGLASNIMKLAMIDLGKAIQDTPYKLLLNVHDELILQSPSEYDEEARDWLIKMMEGVTFNDAPILGIVPLTVEAGIGRAWSDAK